MFGAAPIRSPSFSDILDDLVEEQELGRRGAARAERDVRPDMDWLFHLLAAAAQPRPAEEGTDFRSAAYRQDMRGDMREDLRQGLQEDWRELPLLADDEESVAAELNLSRVDSLAELRQIRRAFAMRNHPDRLHPSVQAAATRRMKIANMLIDRRGKELRR